jgi:predicted RNA binding protein YcfA (HicA-like mRNA interferase family)
MPLSGKAMVKLFEKCGWVFLRQNGSHVIMGKDGEIASIPMHKELGKGMEFKLLKRLKEEKK